MLNKNTQNETWKPDSKFLPYMFTGGNIESLEDEEKGKIEQFETNLSKDIKNTDTINNAVKKMVKAALLVEFGPNLVSDKGSQKMIDTITSGIIVDPTLRKQALIIIDKLTEQCGPSVMAKENPVREENLY